MPYRKLYRYTGTPSLLKLYLTTVWPHLEYASSVQDPYLKKDIEAIECVQKFGLKVCESVAEFIDTILDRYGNALLAAGELGKTEQPFMMSNN